LFEGLGAELAERAGGLEAEDVLGGEGEQEKDERGESRHWIILAIACWRLAGFGRGRMG
jgi:hypothetical protein